MACVLDKLDPLGRSSCLDQIVSYVSQRASGTRRKTMSALRGSRLRILLLSWIGVMDSMASDRPHAGPEKGTGCIFEFSPLYRRDICGLHSAPNQIAYYYCR
jgi:hypothetical protein